MKKWLLLFLCLTFHFGVFAQTERNAQWYQNAIQKLKQQPSSFGRDTLLIQYYHYLMTKRETEIQTMPAYVDSIVMLSHKTKWTKSTQFAHHAVMYLASQKQALGLWDESNALILKEIHILRSTKKSINLYHTLLWWANNLRLMGKYDQSLNILNECLPYAQSTRDIYLFDQIYVNMGYNFISKKMYPQAQSYFEKAYSFRDDFLAKGYCHSAKDSLQKMTSWKINLIEVYLLNNQRAKAEKMIPWVENAIKINDDNFEQYYLYSRTTNAYIEIGDYKKAEKYALKCAFYAKRLASRAHDLVVNTNLYKVYKALGKNDLALNYLEELKKVEAAIAFDKMNAKVTELQLKYDTETKQEKINQLTIEQQGQTQKYLLAGLFLLIGLVGYVVWNYRKLLQKNKEISTAMLHGQTTERKRVAADLHDNLGSTLSSIRWSMQAIDKKKLSTDEQTLYVNLQEMLDKAHNDIRLLSHNLLPEELEKQGLWDTLQSFIRKLNKNTLTHFDLQLPDNQARLSSKIEFELYSICLELTNNILKHANATEAQLVFERQNGSLHLHISDNGKGLDATRQNGKGLANVAARVEALGGKWEMENREVGGVVNHIVVSV